MTTDSTSLAPVRRLHAPRVLAITLRQMGRTYDQIAAQLGISRAYAHKLVNQKAPGRFEAQKHAQRTLVRILLADGLSCAEVGRILHIAPNTVSRIASRNRAQIEREAA